MVENEGNKVNKTKNMNDIKNPKKQYIKKLLTFCILLIIITSLISEYFFSNLYKSKTIITENSITGEVRGDLNFYGEGIYKFWNSHSLHGINWSVNVTNLEKIVIEEGRPDERVIFTKNLEIIPLVGNYRPRFSIAISYDNFNISNIDGKLRYNQIESHDDGISLYFTFHAIESNLNAILNDYDKLRINDVYMFTDNKTLQIIKVYGVDVTIYSNKLINVRVLSSRGSSYGFHPSSSYFPDPLHLNGKLVINEFDGMINYNGWLYFSNSITIESSNILINTIEHPQSGHDGAFFPADKTYWKIHITFKESKLNIEGFCIPYWSVGTLLSMIPVAIIIYFGRKKYKKIIDKAID
jgi:hypothetical protein